ncbi:MAG: hypothetical protein KGY99_07790 [Phycisphaerae bacterium]|nr:hypothetical protein [Phycisphaerae bacterium]
MRGWLSFRVWRQLRPLRLVGLGLGLLVACVFNRGCACVHRERLRAELLTPRHLRPQGEEPPALHVGGGAPGQPRLVVDEHIPVLHLYGTGREMAQQYGRLLGAAIRAFVAYGRAMLPEKTMQPYIAHARTAAGALPEDFREQIRIIAEQADVPYDYLLALNVVPRVACSTLAMWGEATRDGTLLMGRNADYFDFAVGDRGSVLVVYHATDARPFVAMGFVGMVGAFTGINTDGVVFGNMLVFNAADPVAAGPRGLPIQLAMRLAAQRSGSAAEMVAALGAMKHAIAMNVMVADAGEALVCELHRDAHTVRRGKRGVLAATNNFVATPARSGDRRCSRLDRLRRTARARHGQMTVDDIKRVLHAVRVERFGVIHNVQSVIFEPGSMRMHVSLNRIPATAGPWKTYDLRDLLAA